MGPMTGRGMGYCNPAGARAGWFGRGLGRGWGRGRGRGFGLGRGYGRGFGWGGWGPAYYDAPYAGAPAGWGSYAPPMSREEEVDFLQNQAQAIKDELESIEARINDLQQEG